MKPQPAPLTIPVFTALKAWPERRAHDKRVKVPRATVEAIRTMKASGATHKQICMEHPNISSAQIFRIMHDMERRTER